MEFTQQEAKSWSNVELVNKYQYLYFKIFQEHERGFRLSHVMVIAEMVRRGLWEKYKF